MTAFVIAIVELIAAEERERKLYALAILPAMVGSFVLLDTADWALHDRIAFETWYPSHRDRVAALRAKDGSVMAWDEWGMAGLDEQSFLVADADNALADASTAKAWAHRHHYVCHEVDAARMRDGLYILTASNCGFE